MGEVTKKGLGVDRAKLDALSQRAKWRRSKA